MQCDDYERDGRTARSLALGWFSIALGVAELVAPRQMARLVGLSPSERTTTIVRAFGARQMASGVGLLAQPTEAKWLWSRVGGDAVDLATLGQAARNDTNRTRLSLATAAVLGVTALDVLAARSAQTPLDEFGFSVADEQAVTVKAPLETVEAAWVLWCSSSHTKLKNNYAVRFEPAPGARGTEVHLAGGGSKGAIREELRRFKQVLETGEILMSDGPGLWRPAQPPSDAQEVRKLAEVL
ncbi:MAG: hypothetical protein EHM55_04930 [Acidobacteria bacterium]|nr:MAG: hypothetical protein EHM55_04930 [Acidobacteriota bacterium]